MKSTRKISDNIYYLGANDRRLALFENLFPLNNGVSYNSYVILDEKITVMDTVDKRKTEEWFANLEEVLGGAEPAYLVVSHLEPDHASNIQKFLEKYPNTQVVGNAKTFAMLPQQK